MYVRRALILAVALALAAPAAAQQARGPASWALLAGVEDGNGDAGLQLRADIEFPQRPLSPMVGFSIVGSIAYSRFHDEYTDLWYGESVEASMNLFKVIPTARFSLGHAQIRPYLDAGIGLYYGSWSWEYRDLVYGYGYGADDNEVGLLLKLAAGATFQVSPTFALGAEIGFLPYLGDMASDTTTSALVSATFRM